jgi:hypothetical protein
LTNDDEDKDINIIFHTEKTELLYGIENAMSRLTQVMLRVSNSKLISATTGEHVQLLSKVNVNR